VEKGGKGCGLVVTLKARGGEGKCEGVKLSGKTFQSKRGGRKENLIAI